MPYDMCAVIKLIGPPERFFITWLDSIPSSYRKSLTTLGPQRSILTVQATCRQTGSSSNAVASKGFR